MTEPHDPPGWAEDPQALFAFRYRSTRGWTDHVGVYEVTQGHPAWGPDPGGGGLRFWDGYAWTDLAITPDGDPTVYGDPPAYGDPTVYRDPGAATPTAPVTDSARTSGRVRIAVKVVVLGVALACAGLLAWLAFGTGTPPSRETPPVSEAPLSSEAPPGGASGESVVDVCRQAVRQQFGPETGGPELEWSDVTVDESDPARIRVEGSVTTSESGTPRRTSFVCTVGRDADRTPYVSDLELTEE